MTLILGILWSIIGHGMVQNIVPYDENLAIQTAVGVWLYEDWSQPPLFIPGIILGTDSDVLIIGICGDAGCDVQLWEDQTLIETIHMNDFAATQAAWVDETLIAVSDHQLMMGEQIIQTQGIFESLVANAEWVAVIDTQCEAENTRTLLNPVQAIRLISLDDVTQSTCLIFSGYGTSLEHIALHDEWIAAWTHGGWTSAPTLNIWNLNALDDRIVLPNVGVAAFYDDKVAVSIRYEVQIWQIDDFIAGEGDYESYTVEDYPHTILMDDTHLVIQTRDTTRVITPDEDYSTFMSLPRLTEDGQLIYLDGHIIRDEAGNQLETFWARTRGVAYLPNGDLIYGACSMLGFGGRCAVPYLVIGDQWVSVPNEIRYITMSPSYIAVTDGGVRLLNHQGEEVRVLLDEPSIASEFTWGVWNAEFSPDGHYLAAGALDGLYVWDMDNLDAEPQLVEGGWIPDVAFSPDSTRLAIMNREGLIRVLDVESLEDVAQFQNSCCGGDGIVMTDSVLAAGSCATFEDSMIGQGVCENSQVTIWSLADHSMQVLEGMNAYIVNIAIQGKYLAVAAYTDGLWLWDLETGESQQYNYGEVHSVVFYEDQLAADSSQGVIYLGTFP